MNPATDTAAVALFSAASALAMPPAAFGVVPDSWNGQGIALAVAEFEIELWAAAALTLTNPRVIGMVPHPGVIADDVSEAIDTTANTVTYTAHGLQTGDGPVRLTQSSMAGGLAAATDYWIIKVDADKVKYAATRALALAGTAVDITSAGTGNITMADTADTQLVSWHDLGLINSTISLGASAAGGTRDSVTVRVAHRAGVLAYSVASTVSTSTVSGRMWPIYDQGV